LLSGQRMDVSALSPDNAGKIRVGGGKRLVNGERGGGDHVVVWVAKPGGVAAGHCTPFR
jgi:hypothetical protein